MNSWFVNASNAKCVLHEKMCLLIWCVMHQNGLYVNCRKMHTNLCLHYLLTELMDTVVYIDKQRMPGSDSMDGHADLSVCYDIKALFPCCASYVYPVKTQINMHICTVWSVFSAYFVNILGSMVLSTRQQIFCPSDSRLWSDSMQPFESHYVWKQEANN